MYSNRQVKIIYNLMTAQKYLSSVYLAKVTNCSNKTVKNEIKEINAMASNDGFYIEARRGRGYLCKISEQNAYARSFKEMTFRYDNADLDQTVTDALIVDIMELLLKSSGCLKLEEIGTKLFFSRSRIKSLMRQVKKRFNAYNIEYQVVPHQGVKLSGGGYRILSPTLYFGLARTL